MTVNTIALFGATGKTGSIFMRKALESGLKVQALVRSPEKIKAPPENLRVIKGDVLDRSTVAETVEGTDMVVSLFGHVKGSPARLQTDGTLNIIKAMQENGQKRIISLSGGGLPYPEKDQPKFGDKMIRGIMKIAVPKILEDAIDHHRVLKESDLDWMIIRGPRLTDEPEKGDYRVGWVGVNASTKIGRADLADFILKQVKNWEFSREMPFVSY